MFIYKQLGEFVDSNNFSYKFPIAGFLIGGSINVLISSFIEELSSLEYYACIGASLIALCLGVYLLRKDFANYKVQTNKSSLLLIFGTLLGIWGISAFVATFSYSKPIELIGPAIWVIFAILSIYSYCVDYMSN